MKHVTKHTVRQLRLGLPGVTVLCDPADDNPYSTSLLTFYHIGSGQPELGQTVTVTIEWETP